MFSNDDGRFKSVGKPEGFIQLKDAYQASRDLVGHSTFRVRLSDRAQKYPTYYAIGYRNKRETLEGPRSWCYFDRVDGYTQ